MRNSESPRLAILAGTLAAFALVLALTGSTAAQGPQRGQEVVFFHSPLAVAADGSGSLTIQGRIYEPAEQSKLRELWVDALARAVRTTSRNPFYRARASALLSDSRANVQVSVKLGERVIELPPSDHGGYFRQEVVLTPSEVAMLAMGGVVAFRSEPTTSNPKPYPGTAALVSEVGLMVVTDMDDTIKVTDMLDRDEKVANTFVRPFRAVSGMAGLYRSWKDALGSGIHFHVVSAGPWQLYDPLHRFTDGARYPAFTWNMRSVDIPDPRVLMLELHQNLSDIEAFKVRTIRALMQRFAKRTFVLVGDSGERDPEAYSAIVAEFGDRVDAVFIRDVRGDDEAAQQAARYAALFATPNAQAKLHVFRDPAALPPLGATSGRTDDSQRPR